MMMYMETSSEYSEYFGGNWNLMKTDGLSAWQPTISANPWLYSTELKRISDLIRDPLRKEAMEKAVMNYLMMTYLNVECKRFRLSVSMVLSISLCLWLVSSVRVHGSVYQSVSMAWCHEACNM
nr:hypothetical protein BaRGS_018682 [Batillaria attramentaria]